MQLYISCNKTRNQLSGAQNVYYFPIKITDNS